MNVHKCQGLARKQSSSVADVLHNHWHAADKRNTLAVVAASALICTTFQEEPCNTLTFPIELVVRFVLCPTAS